MRCSTTYELTSDENVSHHRSVGSSVRPAGSVIDHDFRPKRYTQDAEYAST